MRKRFALGLGLVLLACAAYAQSPPTLSLLLSNGAARLSVASDVGSACTVQWASPLSGTNHWQFLTNLTPLLISPCVVAGPNPVSGPCFYRAFAQWLPTNVITTNLLWIPPGTFAMGSPFSEFSRSLNETLHAVTLTAGFYIGKYAVRQGEYLALMGTNPSYFTPANGYAQDLNRPVELVSWMDATNYCTRLTQQEQAAGRLPADWAYRLPSESEWEYACRAGTTTAFSFGNTVHGGMANFYDYYEYDAASGDIYVPTPAVPYLGRPTASGSYQPNPWGLYDTHGNVWQWCQDWYGNYPTGSVTDPQGPTSGSARVIRGGGWNYFGRSCRSAQRGSDDPADRDSSFGFRVVLAPTQP